MNWRTSMAWIAASALVLASAGSAAAQGGGAFGYTHRTEIGAFGGGAWTDSREIIFLGSVAEADVEDSGMWGITADFNTMRGSQVEIFYQRQDSRLTTRSIGGGDEFDTAVEYIHIGGLGGYQRGNIRPYGSFTLGATHFSYDTAELEDEWDFSLTFGFGAKAYVNERIGIRMDGRFPLTFTEGADFWQFTLAGGAFAMF